MKALYFPFSRPADIDSLKRFALLFDTVGFIDPVSDEEWRENLFRSSARLDGGFGNYDELARSFPMLIAENAVKIIDPAALSSRNSALTAAAILSDIQDQSLTDWCAPDLYGLPFEKIGGGMSIWRTFLPKMSIPALEAMIDNEDLQKHILLRGGENTSWMLTYAAGSAFSTNLHLAACHEMGFQPITDSRLHHEYVLRKRARTEKNTITADSSLEYVKQQVMLETSRRVFSNEHVQSSSIEDILNFREKTKQARQDFERYVGDMVMTEDAAEKNDPHLVRRLAAEVSGALVDYENNLASARDRFWPGLVGSLTATGPASASAVGLAATYISGSGYLLAASLAAAALGPLKSVLEYRSEHLTAQRSPSSALAFLVSTRNLK